MRQIFLSIVLLLLMVSTGGCILQDVMNSKAATTLGAVNVVDPNPTSDKVSITLVNQTEILLGVSVLNADAPKDKGIKPGETVVVTIPKNTKPQIDYLTPKLTDKNDLNVLAADGSTNKYIISFAKKNHLIIRNNSGLDLNIQPNESVDIKNRWNKISILKGEMGVISSDVEITKELLDIDLWDRVDLTYENGAWIVKSKNPSSTNIEKIDIMEFPEKMDINVPVTIKAIITPSDAQNQNVIWSVDDNSIAMIEYNGLTALVTGKKAGIVSITVKSENDYLVQKTIKIQVVGGSSEVNVDSILLKAVSTTINMNENTEITAEILPIEATNKNIKWLSSNPEVADFIITGDNTIKVTGYSEGKAKITATTDNGKTADIIITVNRGTSTVIPVTDLLLNPALESKDILINTSYIIRVLVEPANASNLDFDYYVSDSSVISIERSKNTLTIKGVKGGSASLEIVSKGNSSKKKMVNINVIDKTIPTNKSGKVTFTGHSMIEDSMVFTYDTNGRLIEIEKRLYNDYSYPEDDYTIMFFYELDGTTISGADFFGIQKGKKFIFSYKYSDKILMSIEDDNGSKISTFNIMEGITNSRETVGMGYRNYNYNDDKTLSGYSDKGYNLEYVNDNVSNTLEVKVNGLVAATFRFNSNKKCIGAEVFGSGKTYPYTKTVEGVDNFDVLKDLLMVDAYMLTQKTFVAPSSSGM